jgi:hypothetical protein
VWILRSRLRKMPSLQVVPTVSRVWTRWPSSFVLLDLLNRCRSWGPRGSSLFTAPGVCGRPVLDHRGLRRLFKDGARSLLAASVLCRSTRHQSGGRPTDSVVCAVAPSSALRAAESARRPPDSTSLSRCRSIGRRFASTASHGVFKVCALSAGPLRDDSHRHGASSGGPLPPCEVRDARIVAPLSASAVCDRHPSRSCTFVKNSETGVSRPQVVNPPFVSLVRGCHSNRTGVLSSSFLTTSTDLPHLFV